MACWKRPCPFVILAEAARSQPATPELQVAILDVIAQPTRPFLITMTLAGYPYGRPVICVNEGLAIWMVTRRHSKKIGHLVRNMHASLLWSEPPRSVLLQGEMMIIDNQAAVEEFYRRYALKNPERQRFNAADNVERVVLQLRPTFCRADWFAGYTPVIWRPVVSY